MKINTITRRSFQVAGPSASRVAVMREQEAQTRAANRWYGELRIKYNVKYNDEEEFDNANLLTAADHRRFMEILKEERSIVTP